MVAQGRKLTIYDIARLSGSSPSTVSAALSGAWQKRRIKESTAREIQRIAAENGYTINMQARGLRQARSGLVGLTLPVHDNRFFSSLSQSFEAHARERGLCPVIVSTLRDPAEERRTVETLISYAIDSLFIAGATNPDALSDICESANLRHVNIDLPGSRAPSVVSNNYHGSKMLTGEIIKSMPQVDNPLRNRAYFIGGDEKDYATSRRIEAFTALLAKQGNGVGDDQIIACGYSPDRARQEIRALCERIGGLPTGLFVNSLTVFEGVLGYFLELPRAAFEEIVIGCYDYDPFASFLHFPVYMIRQNADKLIARGFELIEQEIMDPQLIEIEPDLIPPRTIYKGPFSELG
jgi:LacI family fructose operon transcriptional repressor